MSLSMLDWVRIIRAKLLSKGITGADWRYWDWGGSTRPRRASAKHSG